MGRIKALFKADGDETASEISVSEWWMEPHTAGPGPHAHDEELEVFYVLEGTMTFLVGEAWQDAPAGTCLVIPPGVQHDFENRGSVRAGVLNVFTGTFEARMPAIAEWFAEHRPGTA